MREENLVVRLPQMSTVLNLLQSRDSKRNRRNRCLLQQLLYAFKKNVIYCFDWFLTYTLHNLLHQTNLNSKLPYEVFRSIFPLSSPQPSSTVPTQPLPFSQISLCSSPCVLSRHKHCLNWFSYICLFSTFKFHFKISVFYQDFFMLVKHLWA